MPEEQEPTNTNPPKPPTIEPIEAPSDVNPSPVSNPESPAPAEKPTPPPAPPTPPPPTPPTPVNETPSPTGGLSEEPKSRLDDPAAPPPSSLSSSWPTTTNPSMSAPVDDATKIAGSTELPLDKPSASPYPENLPTPNIPNLEEERFTPAPIEPNLNQPPRLDNIFAAKAEREGSKLPLILGIVLVLSLLVTGGFFIFGSLNSQNNKTQQEAAQPPKITPVEETTPPAQSVFGRTILDSTPSAK